MRLPLPCHWQVSALAGERPENSENVQCKMADFSQELGFQSKPLPALPIFSHWEICAIEIINFL
jgi:hypothetical protein